MADFKPAASSSAPTVSIIVPVYHVERYLRRALDSVLRQSFPDFELILINDGGNAEETAICEEYARHDARIVYLTQENRGLSAARNRGLELCRGEWIMFLDSDDWVREDCCERALACVRATGADIGVFDLAHTEGDKTEGIPQRSTMAEGVHSGYEAFVGRLRGEMQGYVWNKIYRAALWDGIRFPVGELWEDDAVLHEVLDRAESVAVIHDILYYKPVRCDNLTGRATQDLSYAYWLYVQRRRRWTYLAEHHRELLPVAANNMALTLLEYGRVCLVCTGDRKGWKEARGWARAAKLPIGAMNWYNRPRYLAFLYSRPLFCLLEQLASALKRQRGGALPEKVSFSSEKGG